MSKPIPEVCFDLRIRLLENTSGFIAFEATGTDAHLLTQEAGGHRWQRIPPNEKRGRVHTSTITIAVFSDITVSTLKIDEDQITYRTCRGSGAGGQNRNKRDTAVTAVHEPTGIFVRSENQRSQHQNKETAKRLLIAQLTSLDTGSQVSAIESNRRNQIGAGARADKRKTVALQRDQVTDDITKKKISATQYRNGCINQLWS